MNRLLATLLLALCLPALHAQDMWPPERIQAAARIAPDLRYPSDTSSLGIFASPKMALYKPEGAGPFPALVLQHQCGGLGGSRWQNLSMLEWAKKAVAHGYVVMVVDSLSPRSVDTVCMGVKGAVNFARGTRDALLAGTELAKLPYVDKDRIAMAGYSWGAMNAVLAAGRNWATASGDGFRFRATVAFYPGCFRITPMNVPPYEIVNRDIDRPLLVMMGGKDTETPAGECTSRLEPLQAAGAPVTLHLYEQATHCWDCRNLDGYTKVDVRGNSVVYHYDEAVLKDSEKRMFEFLEKTMRPAS